MIPLSSSTIFRITFEAEGGSGADQFGGYVALDDVTFTEECHEGD